MRLTKKQHPRHFRSFGIEALEGRQLLSTSVAVPGNNDLWTLAGLTGAGAGATPTAISLPAGINRTFSFASITGTVSANTGLSASATPDGYASSLHFTTNVTAVGSLAGIVDTASTGTFALLGLFTGNSITGNAPAAQDYSAIQDNASFSPLVDQPFFVGNGKTSKNVVQTFHVPDGATKLYLGFADSVGTFHGPPGGYADNGGKLTATYNVVVHQAVYGSVLSDVNASPGPGLANWRVYIPAPGASANQYDAGDTVATTDINGNFKFSLLPGTYTIAVEIQNGYAIASPSTYTYKVTVSAAPITGLVFVMKQVAAVL